VGWRGEEGGGYSSREIQWKLKLEDDARMLPPTFAMEVAGGQAETNHEIHIAYAITAANLPNGVYAVR